ncbi:MAG: hypothetical protein ACXWW7_04000 [Nocardioides sp.]
MTQREPRDYVLGGFAYDARVLAASSWYLNLQLEQPLVFGHDEVADDQVEQEFAALRDVFEARAREIHQLVWWHRVRRPVCTCGLVVRSVERLADPVGHLDQQRWTPARVVVVKVDDGSSAFVSGCQVCRDQCRTDDLEGAWHWLRDHTYSAIRSSPASGGLRRVELGPDTFPDDVIHELRRPDVRET